jgi:hypothetical protein
MRRSVLCCAAEEPLEFELSYPLWDRSLPLFGTPERDCSRWNRETWLGGGVLLAVDPSLHNLGFAFFNLSYPENRFDITSRRSWRFGVVHPKGGSRQEKWENAFDQLRACCDWQPTHLAAEWPSFFASMRGKIAASRGHTLELSGIVGYLAVCDSLDGRLPGI